MPETQTDPAGPPLARQDPGPFVLRDTRRRRWAEALRLLPVLGVFLFLLPLLWAADGAGSTARIGLYLFAVWALLILSAGWLARLLNRGDVAEPPEPNADPPHLHSAGQ